MLENRENFNLFRAKGNRDMYELTLTYVNRYQETTERKEIIDAYLGEVGRRYADNLLFRLGNEMVKGTDLENIPWKKTPLEKPIEDREWGYLKRGKDRSRLYTYVRWLGKKEERTEG